MERRMNAWPLPTGTRSALRHCTGGAGAKMAGVAPRHSGDPAMTFRRTLLALAFVALAEPARAVDPPEGFQSLFNGRDLSGWTVVGGKKQAWGATEGVLFVQGGGG